MRWAGAIWRGAICSLGLATWLLPVCMLVFCAAYAFACFERLRAPGEPVKFTYESAEGRLVVVRAESYAIDVESRTIRIYRARLDDAAGEAMVRAESVRFVYRNPGIDLYLSGVRGRIERLPDGKYSFEEFLPKRRETEGETPFRAYARDVRLVYVDATENPRLPLEVSTPRLKIEGVGSRLVGSCTLTIGGVGTFPVRLGVDPSGVNGQADLASTDLAPLLSHARRWLDRQILRDWSPADARVLLATGPIEIAVPRKGDLLLSGDLDLRAEGLVLTDLLRDGRANLAARFNADGADIVGQVEEPGRSLRFDGAVAFGERWSVVGVAKARAESATRLWTPLGKLLPPDLRFAAADWDGKIAWTDDRFEASGTLASRSATWQGETIQNSTWKLGFDGARLTATTRSVRWEGIEFSAGIRYDLEREQLSGWAKADRTDLGALARRFEAEGLAGSVSIQAVLTGTPAKPIVDLAAQGQAVYRAPDEKPRYLGLFDARGRLDQARVSLNRFALTGASGALNGYGSVALDGKGLTGKIYGGGIDLREIHPDLAGTGFFEAAITGTVSDTFLTGRAEAYGLATRGVEIPVANADFVLDRKGITVPRFAAAVGASDATGEATLVFESKKVEGRFEARRVQLEDWFGEDVAGVADVHEGVITGSLDKPTVAAKVEVGGLRVHEVDAERAFAHIVADSKSVNVTAAGIEFGPDQSIAFSGDYDLDAKRGRAQGTFAGLPLDRIPFENEQVALDGAAQGTFSFDADESGVTSAAAKATVADVQVNRVSLGAGEAKVSMKEGLWAADAQIGEMERYFMLAPATYDASTKRVAAKLEAYNFPIDTVTNIFERELARFPEETQRLLDSVNGRVSGVIEVEGEASNPDVRLNDVSAGQLTIAGRSAGSVTVDANRKNGSWEVERADWNEGLEGETKAVLRASGTVDESGPIAVRGDLQNFDISWLHTLVPTLPPLIGSAGFAFVLGGETKSPDLVESALSTEGLGYVDSDGKRQVLPLNLLISDLTIINGLLLANGFASYLDFSGKIEARAPVGAFAKGEAAERAKVTLTANPRSLVDLEETFSFLDDKRSTGNIGASVVFDGVPGDYRVTADLITDGTIAAKGVDTTLQGLQVVADYRQGQLQFGAVTKSSDGGTLEVEGLSHLAEWPGGEFDLREWLAQSPLLGTIKIDSVTVAQDPKSRSRMMATVEGSIGIGGNLFEPRLQGLANEPIRISGVDVTVPSEFGASPGGEAPFINPRFDQIAMVLEGPAYIRTSTANLQLGGSGAINGSLQYPGLTAGLTVEKGVFRLPTNRVELEPGGRLDFAYRTGPYIEPNATLDVRLEGRTSISARRFGDTIERYDVTLNLRGDLLQTGGVNITASSDPPDLSQEQILSILGQKDLIESFARATLRPTGAAAQELVLGYFLPNLVSPLTEGLAAGLNLDYLSIEYNPFDQTVITAAKTIAKGLTIVARRQVNALPGEKPRYELKLMYRPPFRNWIIGRSRFGIGIDQDRPWKITFEYGIRF
ncbi:MAG TPA: translocation/assembly module TamB domain-containing protein [Fimbriimonadaceae bacterium]|nr:translocation/assembly module TamB domain-containing protein [Fimbriimonadaceae bacterium]HRJ97496.1 translocation/assembly module TamB domain-containing protein [Fimbriimonadaceae bacterium]